MTNEELALVVAALDAQKKAARAAVVAKGKAFMVKAIHQTAGIALGAAVVYALATFHVLPTL